MRHNKSLERDFCYAAPASLKKPLNSGVRHHKVQHRDQQRFRHTAPHDWHDLAMLYEWLNRSHIVRWWGGEEARPTRRTGTVLAKRFSARVRHSIHCNAEWKPIGYAQSYVALGSGDGWWEEETDPGVRGIDQSLANASQLGKAGTKLVPAYWLSCCSMIPRSPRSKRTRRRATCERSMLRESGV